MNEHPHDSLPAFVLGALDADEAILVTKHISTCPACRADAEAFRAIVDLLSYSPPCHEPPAHVKRQLVTQIAASTRTPPALASLTRPRDAAYRRPLAWMRTMGAVTALPLVLTLLLALIVVDIRINLDRQQQMLKFIISPATVDQTLQHTDRAPNASGRMYMQRGHNRVMLVVMGLRQPEQGKTYRCWLKSRNREVPAATFTVDQEGAAELFMNAPEPVDNYGEIMVTIEASSDGTAPGKDVVLWAAFRD